MFARATSCTRRASKSLSRSRLRHGHGINIQASAPRRTYSADSGSQKDSPPEPQHSEAKVDSKVPSSDPTSSLPNTHGPQSSKPSPEHDPSHSNSLLHEIAALLPPRAPLSPASTFSPSVPPTPTQPILTNTHKPRPAYSLPPPPASISFTRDPTTSEPLPLPLYPTPVIHPRHQVRSPKKNKPSDTPNLDPSRPASGRTVEIRGIYEGKHIELTIGVIRGGALESIELLKEEGRNMVAYVTFVTIGGAQRFFKRARENPPIYHGRQLSVSWSTPRPEMNPEIVKAVREQRATRVVAVKGIRPSQWDHLHAAKVKKEWSTWGKVIKVFQYKEHGRFYVAYTTLASAVDAIHNAPRVFRKYTAPNLRLSYAQDCCALPKLPTEMGGVVGDGVHEDVGEVDGDVDVEGRVEGYHSNAKEGERSGQRPEIHRGIGPSDAY